MTHSGESIWVGARVRAIGMSMVAGVVTAIQGEEAYVSWDNGVVNLMRIDRLVVV